MIIYLFFVQLFRAKKRLGFGNNTKRAGLSPKSNSSPNIGCRCKQSVLQNLLHVFTAFPSHENILLAV